MYYREKVIVNNKNYRTIWFEGSIVKIINQKLLPHKFEIVNLKSYLETTKAIKTMLIRGSPAIGAAGAYGLAQAVIEFKGSNLSDFFVHIDTAYNTLLSTRPTAYDLRFALDIVKKEITSSTSISSARESAVNSAIRYADDSAEKCKAIGEFGESIIENNSKILTHCNAGALACVDYGTALSPIRMAHYKKKNVFVFVDETRPAMQGAKLTAWELSQEGIPHAIIVDNSAGLFMNRGEITMLITGADRIAINGDTANKIGTYEKAVLAKENNIPFYIAAPSSTIDLNTSDGKSIPIEERDSDEVLYSYGLMDNQEFGKVLIANKSPVRNPVFDVTPARYIKGIITEKGIFKPNEIKEALVS